MKHMDLQLSRKSKAVNVDCWGAMNSVDDLTAFIENTHKVGGVGGKPELIAGLP